MKAYWLRVLGAFLLMKVASSILKDAERLVQSAYVKPAKDAATEVVVADG